MSGSVGEYYQSSGMLSREQLLHLFDRFQFLTSQPGKLQLNIPFYCFFGATKLYFAFHLRDLMRFWGFLNYVSDVKKRISDAVNDKQVKNFSVGVVNVPSQ